jgi:CubicO group peptidase (beta-lactamase class C family)
VVEAASGKSWETVFQERIARPLEMTHTYWTHILLRDAADPHRDDVRNPTLQGGAISTADDNMHFLEMLAAGGSYGSRRVLSAEAVDTLLSDQTAEATRTPTGVELIDSAHYAIGNWCETWEGRRCIRNSSLGAWGVYPWIDRTANLYGIVFLFEKDNAFRLLPHIRGIVDGIVSAHPPG